MYTPAVPTDTAPCLQLLVGRRSRRSGPPCQTPPGRTLGRHLDEHSTGSALTPPPNTLFLVVGCTVGSLYRDNSALRGSERSGLAGAQSLPALPARCDNAASSRNGLKQFWRTARAWSRETPRPSPAGPQALMGHLTETPVVRLAACFIGCGTACPERPGANWGKHPPHLGLRLGGPTLPGRSPR